VKGKEFATSLGIPETELKCSDGRVQRFCQHNGFCSFTSHSKSSNAQMTGINKKLNYIQTQIDAYDLADIYNMDETGLFYNMAPDKTIAQCQIEESKKDNVRSLVPPSF
jgi:hypothetical protein